MKKVRFELAIITVCILLTGNLIAQKAATASSTNSKTFKQAINTCPGALVFGMVSFNYEYLFDQKHGLVARFDYDKISEEYSDDSIDANGFGFLLNYRWHWSGGMKSSFLGTFARYRVYKGDGISSLQEFDLTIPEFTLGLNVGRRWVWDSGLNITASLGYGVSWYSTDADPTNASIESTIKKFEDEYDFFGPFLGELSIGYAFNH